MKVVVNKCYGGFGLSPKAVARIAEIEGRPCYFFCRDLRNGLSAPRQPIALDELEKLEAKNRLALWTALDVPDEAVLPSQENWHRMSLEERKAVNEEWDKHMHKSRYDSSNRHYAPLVQVVEELGDEANGGFARLQVIEIPDGKQYVIDEYDGIESVHEAHEVWG